MVENDWFIDGPMNWEQLAKQTGKTCHWYRDKMEVSSRIKLNKVATKWGTELLSWTKDLTNINPLYVILLEKKCPEMKLIKDHNVMNTPASVLKWKCLLISEEITHRGLAVFIKLLSLVNFILKTSSIVDSSSQAFLAPYLFTAIISINH